MIRFVVLITLSILTLLLLASCSRQVNTPVAGSASSEPLPIETFITIQETNDQNDPANSSSDAAFDDPKYDEEKRVYEFFNQEVINKEDEKEIIRLLSGIDWIEYYRLTDGDLKLMEWILQLEITESDDVLQLLNSTNGLDGAMADTYSSIMGNLLEKNMETFISCMTQLNEAKAEIVYNLIGYDLSYDDQGEVVVTKLNELLKKELSAKESDVCRRLLQEIELRN